MATGIAGPVAEAIGRQGARVHVIKRLRHPVRPFDDFQATRDLRVLIRTLKPDVVHGHSSKAGLLARIASRLEGVPSVYTAHGWPFTPEASPTRRTASWAGEAVGAIAGTRTICLNETEAALARRAHLPKAARIDIVANGLGDSDVRGDSFTGTIRLLMAARFAAPKAQLELLHGLAATRGIAWTMTFAGDGPLRAACERFVAESSIGDRVRFLGNVDDVAALLETTDVLVLWSGHEGQPMSVMEAMRAQVPVLSNELPGVREMLGPGAMSIPRSPASLHQAMQTLADHPALRRSLGCIGRQRYESNFGREQMVDGVARAYAAAIATAGKP